MLYWPFHEGVSIRGHWWRRGGPRSVGFASARVGGRLHAACDLRANRGTLIRAVTAGTIIDYSEFYEGTWELVVLHRPEEMEHFIVRYGEVLGPGDAISWANGQTVEGGADIACVGQLPSGASMLHFELYASIQWPNPSLSIAGRWHRAPDSYSDEDIAAIQRDGRWHWAFQRRVDLADPTDFLLALRDGQSPPQPVPVNQDQGILMEALQVTPSEGYYRRQRAIERRRQERLMRRWVEDYLRVHGSRLRMPGSTGIDLESELHRAMERERHQWLYSQRQIQMREILHIPGPTGMESGRLNPTNSAIDYYRHGPD